MSTLVYTPGVRVAISTRTNGIIDVSDDILSGSLTINSNQPHSFSLSLMNPNGKYSQIFTPNDRIIVQMKRVTWVQVFSGYLNEVPYMAVYPSSLSLSASCTSKRIMYHYWAPTYPPTIEAVQRWLGSGNTQQGITNVIQHVLTDVVGWDQDKIHIGRVPAKWVQQPLLQKLWQDVQLSERNITQYLGTNPVFGNGSTKVRGLGQVASVVNGTTGPPGTDLPHTTGQATYYIDNGSGTISGIEIGPTPKDPWYCAMKWGYAALPKSEWQAAKDWLSGRTQGLKFPYGLPIVVTNVDTRTPGYGNQIVVHAADDEGGLTSLQYDKANPNSGNAQHIIDLGYLPWSSLAGCSIGDSTWGLGVMNVTVEWAADPNQKAGLYKKGTQPLKVSSNHLSTGTGGPNVGTQNVSTKQAPGATAAVQQAITWATTTPQIPYAWGGTTPAGFDCSGLTQACWLVAGVNIQRTSQDQYNNPNVVIVPLEQILPGDLLFFNYPGPGGDSPPPPGHVMIYVGDNTVVQAEHPGAGGGVQTTPLKDALSSGVFMGVGRVTMSPSDPKKSGQKVSVTKQDITAVGTAANNSGLATDTKGYIQTGTAWIPGAAAGDELTLGFTGYKLLYDDVGHSVLSYVKDLVQASQRHWCTAPNGDFIAWFPDYFGAYGATVWHLSELEMLPFQISWSDSSLITHQFVSGNIINQNTSIDPLTGEAQPSELDFILSSGVATIDIPGILEILTNTKPTDGGLFSNVQEIYKQFGPRPNAAAAPLIGHGEVEFWFALSLWMLNWASMFNATVPMTFMPELWPGMLLALDDYGVQFYITSVTHSFNLSQNSAGFSTTANVIAPSALDGSGLIGIARSGVGVDAAGVGG